ncbi:MAG TPA: ATP-binding protein [Chitinophagaceae bacterium]|jgi:signal transduction histidine kinase|nr:ATP-binding protein [Chitinophagaceae bacterium]
MLILVLFSLTTYMNYKRSAEVQAHSDYVFRSSEVVRLSGRLQRNTLNMISGLRGYLLTGDAYFIQSYDSAVAENESTLAELSRQIEAGSPQQRLLKEITELHQHWVEEYTYPLRDAKMAAQRSEANIASFNRLYREKVQTGEERLLNQQIQAKFRALTNEEYEDRRRRINVLTQAMARTTRLSFTLTVLSIVVGFLVAAFLAYGISSRILNMVRMADTIAAGDYKVHMKDTGKDELSRLAGALNHMAHVLSVNFTQLQQKNRELDQFAHIVSHDLKAPLRGIGNVVSWIEEDHAGELSPKVQDYLQLVKGRISRGEALIDGILSYARVGKSQLPVEQVAVGQLLEEVRDTLAIPQGLNLLIAGNLPVVNTEKVLLLQVFTNLISNAVKYHNKPAGWVKVYHREESGRYVFYVEDNGPGIPPQYHERIFVIFQTLQERDTFESTGVGLAIVKKILDARNERIEVVSEPGLGSKFSFTWTK